MPFTTIATSRTLALVAALAFLAFVATSSAAASAALPALASVAPWSARCYTDTCVGLQVTFDGGHSAALGHTSDSPDSWAIRESTNLTADEAALAEASVSALAEHNLHELAAAYPELPAWYMDALTASLASTGVTHQYWLPLVVR
jgi:hypothetical protein